MKKNTKMIIGLLVIATIGVWWYMRKGTRNGVITTDGTPTPTTGGAETESVVLHADKIVGTNIAHKNPDNRKVFVVGFNSENRSPNGAKLKKYTKATIDGAGTKYDGTYETRPSWTFVDSKGRLGNVVLKGVKIGDKQGKVKITLFN